MSKGLIDTLIRSITFVMTSNDSTEYWVNILKNISSWKPPSAINNDGRHNTAAYME